MSYTPPPPPPYGGAPSMKPDNYLVWSILTTIFCCLPFGIVAIVQSAKVDSLWAAGQYAEAQQASASAKKWSLIGVGIGVTVGVLYLVLVIGLGVLGSSGY